MIGTWHYAFPAATRPAKERQFLMTALGGKRTLAEAKQDEGCQFDLIPNRTGLTRREADEPFRRLETPMRVGKVRK